MVACVLVAAAWYVTVAPTGIGGPLTPVIVRGTSMLPTYEPGDLVLAYRSRGPRVGQVVVFRGPSEGYVIHRITAVDGERITTQGDNRDRPDPWATTADDVVGVARLAVPGIGRYLLVLADPLVIATLAGSVAATVVLRPRRSPVPTAPGAAVAVIAVAALWPVVGIAAGLTVNVDQLMTQTLSGPFETYVVAPGGGGGGCNGQGNRPGC